MRKIKKELMLALVLSILVIIPVIYLNAQKDESFGYIPSSPLGLQSRTLEEAKYGNIKEIIRENIVGELRKGSFEEVIEDIRNLTFYYAGRVPYLNMRYENELWSGWLTCKLPTENVTVFTFDVRKLINEHGKVTHISIDIIEEEINETEQPEMQFSEVNISLKEFVEGESPILSQLGTVLSYLTTAILWIAQGIILGVPLCFASLGVVMLVDRVIVPAWRKQFKGKSLNKPTV